MRTIILMCSAGASTSMLMKRMKAYADEIGYECTIEAHPVTDADKYADSDLVLLGPQVQFMVSKVRQKVNCPVEAIDFASYGSMDGKAALMQAKKVLGD